MSLRETLSNTWDHVQGFLLPMLREETGPLTAQHHRLVVVLEVAGVEAFARTAVGRRFGAAPLHGLFGNACSLACYRTRGDHRIEQKKDE